MLGLRKKAELNRRLEPGRFVITGSTRFDALAVARHAESRSRWIDDYVRVSLARDVIEMARIRQGAHAAGAHRSRPEDPRR